MHLLNNSDINVSDICLQSYPCQHKVSIKNTTPKLLYGTDIYKLYVENNLLVPEHFKIYKNYIMKQAYYNKIKNSIKSNNLDELSSCCREYNFNDFNNYEIDSFINDACIYSKLDSYETVKYLLNVCIKATITENTLMFAVYKTNKNIDDKQFDNRYYTEHPHMIDLLIKYIDEDKLINIVYSCIMAGGFELAKYLMITYNLELEYSLLKYAIDGNNKYFIDYFINKFNQQYEQDVLTSAVVKENYEIIKYLLDNNMIDDHKYHINVIIRKNKISFTSEMYKILSKYLTV